MNTDTIKGDWNITKGRLKKQYAQLTDNDLVYVEGREDELIGRIQKKTGRAREEIEKFLSEDCDSSIGPNSRGEFTKTNQALPGRTMPPTQPRSAGAPSPNSAASQQKKSGPLKSESSPGSFNSGPLD